MALFKNDKNPSGQGLQGVDGVYAEDPKTGDDLEIFPNRKKGVTSNMDEWALKDINRSVGSG